MAGFSFRTKIDLETNQVSAASIRGLRARTALRRNGDLWMPAEKDDSRHATFAEPGRPKPQIFKGLRT